jgi:hypothetical protein
MKAMQVRQGDVFLERVEAEEAKGAEELEQQGRVILAAGEVTGHHHAVPLADAALLAKGAQRFLKTNKRTALAHEEHERIELRGRTTFEVVIQREYTPEEIRNVLD